MQIVGPRKSNEHGALHNHKTIIFLYSRHPVSPMAWTVGFRKYGGKKMAGYRKLGRTSSQRKAMIRSQVTALLYHGNIKTTEARAKEIRKVAEGLIALAVKEKDNFETVKGYC